jgi:hypothetical protein
MKDEKDSNDIKTKEDITTDPVAIEKTREYYGHFCKPKFFQNTEATTII